MRQRCSPPIVPASPTTARCSPPPAHRAPRRAWSAGTSSPCARRWWRRLISRQAPSGKGTGCSRCQAFDAQPARHPLDGVDGPRRCVLQTGGRSPAMSRTVIAHGSSHPTNGRCSADVLAAAPLARPVTWDQSSKRGTASFVTLSIARAPFAGSVATTTRSELTEGRMMSMVSAVLHDQEAPPTVDSSDAGEPSAAVSNRRRSARRLSPPPLPTHHHCWLAVSVFSLDPSVSVRFQRGDPSGDGAPA